MWSAYLRKISGDAPQKDIAKKVGVTQPTVSRWLSAGLVPNDAAVVAHVAQQYERNPLEAFVAAGMLSPEDAGRGLNSEERELLSALDDRLVEEADDGEEPRPPSSGPPPGPTPRMRRARSDLV